MDDIVDMMTFSGYGVHLQCMLGNIAQHCKSRSLCQSDQHKVGSVDGESTNRGLRWRSKMYGKNKTVDQRSFLNIKLIGDQ